MKGMLTITLALGATLAAGVACFSDRTAGPPANSLAACRVPITVIDSMHYLVAIRDFLYRPDSLAVPPGATVSWVNCEDAGQEPHTATSDTAGVFDSALLVSGARYSHRFTNNGVFPYFCTEHAYMTGKIVVQ
jgi:plastocyanin